MSPASIHAIRPLADPPADWAAPGTTRWECRGCGIHLFHAPQSIASARCRNCASTDLAPVTLPTPAPREMPCPVERGQMVAADFRTAVRRRRSDLESRLLEVELALEAAHHVA